MLDDVTHEFTHPSHTTQLVLLVLFCMLVAWNVLLLSLATGQRFQRKRRAKARVVATVPSTPLMYGQVEPVRTAPTAAPAAARERPRYVAPPPPAKTAPKQEPGILRSTLLLVLSLIAVAVVGGLLFLGVLYVTRPDYLSNPDDITIPRVLLGQAIDDDRTSRVRKVVEDVAKDVGFGADVSVGAYGQDRQKQLVVLSLGTNGDRITVADLDEFAKDVSVGSDGTFGRGRAVPTGRLGGLGRCATLNDHIGRASVCIYLHAKTSVFLLIDYAAASPASGAARSLHARELIVHATPTS